MRGTQISSGVIVAGTPVMARDVIPVDIALIESAIVIMAAPKPYVITMDRAGTYGSSGLISGIDSSHSGISHRLANKRIQC